VRALPEIRFVVDHAGKPGIAAGEWASWIAAMARCDNVVCKLSGLVTEADWDVARIRRYAEHVLTAFGSDWPVCELAAGCGEVLALPEDLLGGCSATARAAVLGGTARRVYAFGHGTR
jgi:L-fuconolactonase